MENVQFELHNADEKNDDEFDPNKLLNNILCKNNVFCWL